MTVQLYFDGACDINPGGNGGIGYLIKEGGIIHEEHFKHIGQSPEMTCNIAEWTALIEGMKLCLGNGYLDVEVYGDSQLIVNQAAGKFQVKVDHLKPFKREFTDLLKNFNSFYIEWIPREQNEDADRLSKQALEEYSITKKGFKLK